MELTERVRAERALDGVSGTTDHSSLEWPSAASRIRDARLTRGLDDTEVARRLGISVDSYCDLEAYDDEAFTVATLRSLVTLGHIVSEEPKVLLLGPEVDSIKHTITPREIAERLAKRIAERRVTADQVGEEIGFGIEPLLESPDNLWDYDVEALYNICKYLDLDWVAALPDLATAGTMSSAKSR